ncbi:MAG TPA: DUF3810 domain-containing protein [Flavobacterium sp.]|jgi:hypothetical protein
MLQKKYILPLLLLFQVIILKIIALFPEVVEQVYSNCLYVWVSKFSRSVFGLFVFSVGDVIYSILILLVLKWFYINRKTWRKEWKHNLLKIISCFSVFYFVFNLLWAVNYHRVLLAEKMNIKTEYSDTELIRFTQQLIAKTNAVHKRIVNNDTIKIIFPYTREQIFELSVKGYETLSSQYPFFTYTNPSIKKSLFSLPLTYMGFAGYLNPFTGEAQVNNEIPMYNFPTTVTHEMAHQIGYASESEANFIGFLASVKNDDVYMQYSGYSFALKYCLNALERIKEGKSRKYLLTINKGVLKDFEESRMFWLSHRTFIDTGFEIFYDQFLKMNQQKEGLESYSRFVDLMVNYYKHEKL